MYLVQPNDLGHDVQLTPTIRVGNLDGCLKPDHTDAEKRWGDTNPTNSFCRMILFRVNTEIQHRIRAVLHHTKRIGVDPVVSTGIHKA